MRPEKINNEWLIPVDIAKKLKEIGFDEPTMYHYYENDFDIRIETKDFYNEGDAQGYLCFYLSAFKEENFNKSKVCISIPTYEQVFEWFRDKGFDSYIGLENHPYPDEGIYYYFEISKPNLYRINQLAFQGDFDDYNEAREYLVKALIRTYKQEQLK